MKTINKYSLILFSLLFLSAVSACRKEGAVAPDTDTCVAGTGGSIDLIIFPQHHGAPVFTDTAYIEFNTQSSPGLLSNFDLVVAGDSGVNHVRVDNMKCGNYFIYCVGRDSSQTVRGGIPFAISKSATGDINVIIPVVE
jgi:hypothetical protein